MASPYLYAALSVIPGLGMLALKEYRKGVITFGIILLFGNLYLFSNSEILSDMSLGLLLFSWIGQVSYTFQIAQRKYREESGESTVKPTSKIKAPANSTRKEKLQHRVTEQIRQQLNTGETLLVGMGAMPQSIFGLMSQFLIGLTEGGLLIIKLDLVGKPLDVSRYPFDQIDRFEISKRGVNRKVQFWLSGNKKPLTLQVSNLFHADDLKVLEEKIASMNK